MINKLTLYLIVYLLTIQELSSLGATDIKNSNASYAPTISWICGVWIKWNCDSFHILCDSSHIEFQITGKPVLQVSAGMW